MTDRITGALESGNSKKQVKALEELNRLATNSPEKALPYIPAVIPLVNSPDAAVSALALAFLASVSSKDPKSMVNAVPYALNVVGKTIQLGAGAGTMFSQCANALVILGDASLANPEAVKTAVPYIIRIISPPIYKPETFNETAKILYVNAVSALAKIGSKNPTYIKDAVPHLVRVLSDSYKFGLLKKDGNNKGGIRFWTVLAIHYVGGYNPAFVVPSLIKIMSDPTKEIQSNAESAIMRFFSKRPDLTVPAEISTLSDADDKVRKSAIYILQKQVDTAPKVVIPYLLKAVESDNKQIKQLSIQLLAKAGAKNPAMVKPAVPVIIKNIKSRDKDIKQTCIEAVGTLAEGNVEMVREAIPYITEALKDPIGNTRYSAVNALEKIADKNPNMLKGVLPHIYRCLQDPAEHVRWRAQELFEKLNLDPKRYPIVMSEITRLAETLRNIRKTGADTKEIEEGIKSARKALDNFDLATAEKIVNDTMKIANELYVKSSGKSSAPPAAEVPDTKVPTASVGAARPASAAVPSSGGTTPAPIAPTQGSSSASDAEDDGLLDIYTFDNFVVGPSNSLAHAAAMAVSKTPSRSYNPLFIYSGPGLGKTHLLQAIGNEIKKRDPTKKVRYVTSERLVNDLISATEGGWLSEFRRRYRDIDVLLVDDVHFLAGKERMQEEFFHTFNALYNSNKQIVLTSDRPPKEIATLEERLRSRFEWGFVVDIQPPTFETRLAILRKKVENKHQEILYEVLSFIATYITDNIRELDGALNKIVAYSTLTGKKVDLKLAREVLKGMLPPEALSETAGVEEKEGAATAAEEIPAPEVKEAPKAEPEPQESLAEASADLDDDFEPEWGVTYLAKESRPDKAYRFFNMLVKNGAKGIIITRIHPDKARKKFDISADVPIYWLSKAPGEFCRTPTNIGKLAFTITNFAKENKPAVILLDGLEYIISNNDFPLILRWLDDVHEGIVLSNAIFIVPITPETYTTKELTLLERNAKTLTEKEIKNARAFLLHLPEDINESDAQDVSDVLNGPPEELVEEDTPTVVPEEPAEEVDNEEEEKEEEEKPDPMEREAMTALKLASTKITFARTTGADVSEAENLLAQAKQLFSQGEWQKAIDVAKKAVDLAEEARDEAFRNM